MHRLNRKWLARSLLFGCIQGMASMAGATEPDVAVNVPSLPVSASLPHDWIAVDTTILDEMRGGFDIAPGLKVSFGIERLVNLNGVLQTATRIEVPDAGKMIQSQQNPTGVTVSLPQNANAAGGATALIQNGVGNMVTQGAMSADAAATFIQNSTSNQTIQSMTVINAATNSLELLKGANLQSTLVDALTQSAGTR